MIRGVLRFPGPGADGYKLLDMLKASFGDMHDAVITTDDWNLGMVLIHAVKLEYRGIRDPRGYTRIEPNPYLNRVGVVLNAEAAP